MTPLRRLNLVQWVISVSFLAGRYSIKNALGGLQMHVAASYNANFIAQWVRVYLIKYVTFTYQAKLTCRYTFYRPAVKLALYTLPRAVFEADNPIKHLV
jgi:hypothetical protein